MDVQIEIKYETPSGIVTTLESDNIEVKRAIIIVEDMMKTGRIKAMIISDGTGQHWTLKQLKKYTKEIASEPHQIIVYFDGSYDVQTNQAGLGIVIYYEQQNRKYRKRMNAFVNEIASNNEAEYAALHLSVKELAIMKVKHMPVTFIGDSKVVVNQLNDEWPCYEQVLLNWMERLEDEINRLSIKPTFESVSRKQNKEADQLASQALQHIEIESITELKKA